MFDNPPKTYFSFSSESAAENIEKVERYSKNSLAVKIKGLDKHLIVSQSNTPIFKIWLEE